MGLRRLLSHGLAAVVWIVALAPTPAVGQSGTRAATAWKPARTADGQPNIAGMWTNQGNTGTANIEQMGSRKSLVIDPPDGKVPFQPWAAARKKEILDNFENPNGKLEYVDSQPRCLPDGVPRTMYATPYNGYQFLQIPGYVIFIAEWNHTYRIVPIDGRPHVGPTFKLWMGDSRGRWDGNTLIVHTTNLTDKTWFDHVGTFHSEAMQVVERFTIVDANTIAYQATVEDPKVFTRPWTLALEYKRATVGDGTKLLNNGKLEDAASAEANASPIFLKDVQIPNYELYEYACHEGNRTMDLMVGFK